MVQIIIILAYFAIIVVVGVLAQRRTKTGEAFLGTQLGVFAIVAASTGEWLGGTSTTGVSEYAFNSGISGAWYTIANGIGVFFLASCFAKLYRSLNEITINGIVEKFFGARTRIVSAIILTIVMLAVGLSQMIAAGKLGESLVGINFSVSVIFFLIVFVVYTLAGGMNAVTSTNKIHLFVMYGGVIVGLVYAVHQLGGWGDFTDGIHQIEQRLASEGTEVRFFNWLTIGTPKVSSWIIASLLGACTAQAGLQPVLAARDVHTARKASYLTAICTAPFGIITALLGMAARVQSEHGNLLDMAGSNVTEAKLALPTLMMNMPPIIGGIVLASILAAILSTVSPIILAAGTMISKDVYQRAIKKDATDRQLLTMTRILTAISGVICAVGAIALVNLQAVLDIVYTAYSMRGSLFIVLLLGIFWKKASTRGAIVGMIVTAVAAVTWKVVQMSTGHYPISDIITETYAAVICAFFVTLIFSLILPGRSVDELPERKAKVME
ncbi:MAG TPA: sodium:solute symporter family protein [Anaerovoracaceae bacterium]|nr:sodium:solute symporter family protein [Anaerovoracaceae bacterium]